MSNNPKPPSKWLLQLMRIVSNRLKAMPREEAELEARRIIWGVVRVTAYCWAHSRVFLRAEMERLGEEALKAEMLNELLRHLGLVADFDVDWCQAKKACHILTTLETTHDMPGDDE